MEKVNKQPKTKEVKDIIKLIKANSKDVHYAEKLIKELQAVTEPTLLHLPTSEVLDKIEGETFTLYSTAQGILYHQVNGFDILLPYNASTGNIIARLKWLIDNKEEINNASEDEKKYYLASMLDVASTFQFIVGLWIPDKKMEDFRINTVVAYMEILDNILKESTSELQQQDPEKDGEFKDVALAIEEVKKTTLE